MKKTLAFIILAVMLLSVFTVCASAEDDPPVVPVCPDWLITEIGCDNTANKNEECLPYIINPKYKDNSEPYEFIEITNTSGRELNIYDYAITNCTAVPTSPSFETLVYKVEPIKPDDTWCEWDWGDPLAYWDAGVPFPQNPSYAGGVVEPGETIVLWMYLQGHVFNSVVEDFKAYWRVAPETKVFLVDSNSISDTTKMNKSGSGAEIPYGGAAKNFNMPNSGCSEYGIMLWDEAAQAKFNAMCNDSAGTGVYLAKEGLHYITCDNIVSWAVVYYNMEITDFVESKCQTFNYIYSQTSMLYVDAGGKRAEYSFTADYLDSTVGKLTDEQKASLPDPNDPIFNPVTPGGDDTTPASGDDTTPAPGDDTTPAPGDDTTPAPGNDTTPAPGGDTTPAPSGNDTTKADDKKDDDKKGCKSSFACGIALVAVFGSAVVLGKKH